MLQTVPIGEKITLAAMPGLALRRRELITLIGGATCDAELFQEHAGTGLL
jgi:hypothetical protein